MSSMIVKPPDDEHAYEQIEAAVMETSRGRWFLSEYARRNRHAETVTILDAIERLQRNVSARGGASSSLPYDRLQSDIIDMARAIARTEREIRAIKPNGAEATQFVSASDELDAVVGTTEQATSSILSAAERVQEYAWTMREQKGIEADCDMLDGCATEIYTACGFQDLTAQRIRKVVETLRFLDARLKSILEVTGMAEDFHADEQMISEIEPPEAPKTGSDIWMSDAHQAEIDDTFDFFVPAEISEPTMIGADLMSYDNVMPDAPVAADTAASAPAPAQSAATTPYDTLSTEEKLRAFR
ncbi:MAG: hypothetical protein FD175_51 [Beijerinckiaceae bacterium]|nr:MAG: hypothetical protein FD175_51 [Beijerinckiaceae bacterium]